MSITIRQQLHQQIDSLPDHIVEKIADFTLFILSQQEKDVEYTDWEDKDWKNFALGQFFRDEDEISYSLEDAQEIYQP